MLHSLAGTNTWSLPNDFLILDKYIIDFEKELLKIQGKLLITCGGEELLLWLNNVEEIGGL